MMEYLITPTPKPRMTQSDKWRKIPRKPVGKYWAFCRRCDLLKMELPLSGASVTFVVPMPESWSKKKRKDLDGKPHQSKKGPDVDNFLKALGDALYKNDSAIWDIHIRKIWGHEGKIVITQNQTTMKHLEEFELAERQRRRMEAMLKVVSQGEHKGEER